MSLGIYLLNCRLCDSLVTIHDRDVRCVCGKARAVQTATVGAPVSYTGGPLRLWQLAWEAYDGAVVGEERPLRLVHEVSFFQHGQYP